MSRTKKGSKSPGHEYWGRRSVGPSTSGGTKNKRTGIQKERASLKREIQKEPTEPEYDPEEYVSPDEFKEAKEFLEQASANKLAMIQQVMFIMGWDEDKATLWYHMPNPCFGGESPHGMNLRERAHKVFAFIKNAQEGNMP